jgi:hypothetical protein
MSNKFDYALDRFPVHLQFGERVEVVNVGIGTIIDADADLIKFLVKLDCGRQTWRYICDIRTINVTSCDE